MMLRISLRERGSPSVIPLAHWSPNELETPLRELEELGIVRLAYSSAGVIITPSSFIGRLSLPNYEVNIAPKSPEMLSVMRKLAYLGNRRTATAYVQEVIPSTEGPDGLVPAFIRKLNEAIGNGLPWRYLRRLKITSFPDGCIDFGETIANLAIKGINHQVAVRHSERIHHVEYSRIILTAHEYITRHPLITLQQLGETEVLLGALDQHAIYEDVDEAIEVATNLLVEAAENEWDPSHIDLLKQCIAVLSQMSASGGTISLKAAGTAHFQNLETVWEGCVFHLLDNWSAAFSPIEVELHGLSGTGTKLFGDGGPVLDPDVVLRLGPKIKAVVDAKYKLLLKDSPPAADIYQITAYIRRTQALFGALVYYSETTDRAYLVGTTQDGVPIICIALTAASLQRDGSQALSNLLGEVPLLSEDLKNRMSNGLR